LSKGAKMLKITVIDEEGVLIESLETRIATYKEVHQLDALIQELEKAKKKLIEIKAKKYIEDNIWKYIDAE